MKVLAKVSPSVIPTECNDDQSSVSCLVRCLQDESDSVRCASCTALEKIIQRGSSAVATAALLALAEREIAGAASRAAAVRALGRVAATHDTLVIDALRGLFSCSDDAVRAAAAKAAARIAEADATAPAAAGLQRLEARAFGCLLEELLAHCPAGNPAVLADLAALQQRCMRPDVAARPLFSEIEAKLDLWLAQD